jgi:hypothetical protein
MEIRGEYPELEAEGQGKSEEAKSAEAGEGAGREQSGDEPQSGKDESDGHVDKQPEASESQPAQDGERRKGVEEGETTRTDGHESGLEVQNQRDESERFREQVKENYLDSGPEQRETGGQTGVESPSQEKPDENLEVQVSRHENDPPDGAEVSQKAPEGAEDDPKAIDSRAARAYGADGRQEPVAEDGVTENPASVHEMPNPSDAGPRFKEGSVRDQGEEARAPRAQVRGDDSQEMEVSGPSEQTRTTNRHEEVEKTESSRQYIASFEATAQRRDDDRTAFEVRVESLEQQSGRAFEEGKVYAINVTIDDVGDFRKVYSPGESARMAILAPSRLADSIEPGKKYNVHVTSVEEISRNDEHLGVFSATAYEVPGKEDRIRFDLPKDSFEHRTRVILEEGKIYDIKGNIGDICEFKLTHSGERSEHMFVFAPKEATGMFEPGRKYDLTVTSVEEKSTFTVPYSEAVTRLTLQKRVLESAGIDMDGMKNAAEGDRIVELTIRNLSHEGEPAKRLYTKVNANEGAVVLNIGRAGAKQGDRMELVKARALSNDGFAKEFNEHRGQELMNTRLLFQGEKLELEIDGKRFEVKAALKVQNLRVFMSAEMQPFKRDIRFWFDGETITPKFGQSWQIRSFSETQKGMEMTYSMGLRTITTRSETREFREGRLERSDFLGRVKPLGDIREIEGTHRFEIDSDLFNSIYGRITASMASKEMYNEERGSIGENFTVGFLSALGWKELAAHPFDPSPGLETTKGGTDTLMGKPEGLPFLFESKWHKDTERAAITAFAEVELRRPDEEVDTLWGRPSGAYIAIINVNLRGNFGEIRIRRVW